MDLLNYKQIDVTVNYRLVLYNTNIFKSYKCNQCFGPTN